MPQFHKIYFLGGGYKLGELTVYSAVLVLISIITQNVVLTADLTAYRPVGFLIGVAHKALSPACSTRD